MGKLTELHAKIKALFPEAIDISADGITQDGIYLLFNSLSADSWREDICSYSLLVAGRSLAEDKDAILPLVDELRERFGSKKALDAINGKDAFNGVTVGKFSDTLYVYSLNFNVSIYREMEDLKL
jgi:hypothetical protein